MKEETLSLLVSILGFAIIVSIFCVYEWIYGNLEFALFLTIGSAIAIPFYAIIMVLWHNKKNKKVLEERLKQLEERLEQVEEKEKEN